MVSLAESQMQNSVHALCPCGRTVTWKHGSLGWEGDVGLDGQPPKAADAEGGLPRGRVPGIEQRNAHNRSCLPF